MSLRDQILAMQDIPSTIVEVPEWNNLKVEVRGMTGGDRTNILSNAINPTTGQVDFRVMYPEIVIASCFDPVSGERIFNENDRELLLTKSATALDRLAEVGMSVGGLTKEVQDEIGKRFPDESES